MKRIDIAWDDNDTTTYDDVLDYSMDGKWLKMTCHTEAGQEEYLLNTDKIYEITIYG